MNNAINEKKVNGEQGSGIGAGVDACVVERGVWVPLDCVELDSSTQGRVQNDADVISEYSGVLGDVYAEAWARKGEDASVDEVAIFPFPAVVLFLDSKGRYWVGDGFHRICAAHASEFMGVVADVYKGGVKDALLYALGANASHGLRRGSEDIRRCVELAAMEYPEKSDRELGRLVGCSHVSVGKYRPAGSRLGFVTGGDGKVYGGAGLPEGMDEEPVSEGAEGYVDDGERNDGVSVGAESGSGKTNGGLGADAIMGYDVAFVCLEGKPGIAEVQAWVGADAPSYGELSMDSGVPVVRMRDASGVVRNMVRRELVVEWCSGEVESGKDKGESALRWDGFRGKPVSLEHAEREREKWLGESRRGELVEWMFSRLIGEGLGVDDDGDANTDLMLRQVRKLLPRESVELVRVVEKRWGYGDAVPLDFEDVLLCLLLATPLLERGVDFVEELIVGEGVE